MANAGSTYIDNAVLTQYLVTNTAYVALYTNDPGASGTGSVEVSGGSYVRKAAAFTVASGTATLNADIVWNGMPAVTVGYIALWDASSGGNELFHGALTASKTVAAGDAFALPAGNLTISLS